MKSKIGLSGWALLFNAPFVVWHAHRLAYDTYTHIFLADHYRQAWWSQWEPRWYLGFSMASYPPLAHQLIALVSLPITQLIAWVAPAPEEFVGEFRWASEETAYVLILLTVLMLLPHAMRAFATPLVGQRAADNVAWLSLFTPALALSAWTFGQLPMLMATLWLLWACAYGARFLRFGAPRDLLLAVLLAGLLAVTHHGAFLLAPGLGGAVVLAQFKHLRQRFTRLALWVGLSAGTVWLLLLPFLDWSRGQVLQTAIPHSSRDNFFLNPEALGLFFAPMYGSLLFGLPILGRWAWRKARWRAVAGAGFGLFVFGLGGTTPLPRWVFGVGWAWLTYDRFALGAALMLILPLGVWLRRASPRAARLFVSTLIVSAYLAGGISVWNQLQPATIDLRPLIRFLDEPAQRPYRYLTLGFGEQFAKLSTLTTNGSPDGNYHTARALPELRASGLGALDGAVWTPAGADALSPFLQRANAYGLRWIFVNHSAYAAVLQKMGWVYRFDVGQVQAWEKADVPPAKILPPQSQRLVAIWWGGAPLSLLLTLGGAALWHGRKRWRTLLRWVRYIALGGWFITLWVWWVHIAQQGTIPDLYFTYQSVLVYGSDVLAISLLGLWGLDHITTAKRRLFTGQPHEWLFLALFGWCALSAFQSSSPALTLGFLAHGGLLIAMYWLLCRVRIAPGFLAWLGGGLILWQATVALRQVLTQTSTRGLQNLYLYWPGIIAATTRGASVVGTTLGGRWLRAYGTLPHPNLLGGALLVLLGMVGAVFIRTGQRRWLISVLLGASGLMLTFSRSAWVAGLVALGWLWFTAPPAAQQRVKQLVLASGLAFVVTALPLRDYLFTRATGFATPAANFEFTSTVERLLQLQVGLGVVQQHPFFGVGAGTLPHWLALNPPIGRRIPFQPIHFLPLHIAAEVGLPGGLLALLGVAALIYELWRRRRGATGAHALWGGLVLGLLTITLFDHYWWTTPPMGMLLVFTLAQWRSEGRQFQEKIMTEQSSLSQTRVQ